MSRDEIFSPVLPSFLPSFALASLPLLRHFVFLFQLVSPPSGREGKGSERVIRITYYPKTALAKGLQGLDVSIYERCSRDATRRWGGPPSTIYGSTEFELCNYPRFRLGDTLYAERDEKHNRTFVISNRRMNISRRILDFRKMDDVKLILFVSSLQKKRIPTYIYIYPSFVCSYDCFRIIFRKFTRKIQ